MRADCSVKAKFTMDINGKMTLGELTKQLKEYLKKFGQGLGIDDDEDKGARGRILCCSCKRLQEVLLQ